MRGLVGRTAAAESSQMKGRHVGGGEEQRIGEGWLCVRQVRIPLNTAVETVDWNGAVEGYEMGEDGMVQTWA